MNNSIATPRYDWIDQAKAFAIFFCDDGAMRVVLYSIHRTPLYTALSTHTSCLCSSSALAILA